MLQPTNYLVDTLLIKEAIDSINFSDFKTAINEPSGDFFYDPWIVKPEFKNTVWDKILNSLPEIKGEARIINLKPGTAYYCHADTDDRWHLNLQSEYAYICDLKETKMFPIESDGIWYTMDAGRLHTAANFGDKDRIQLVVRQLLLKNNLDNPLKVTIKIEEKTADYRYQFDQTVSSWLNRANKRSIISNFVFNNEEVTFNLEQDHLHELEAILPKAFKIVI
jgi:hypothetical protein